MQPKMSDPDLTSLTWLSSIDTGGVSRSDLMINSSSNEDVEYHSGTSRPCSSELAPRSRARGANYRSLGDHPRPPCSYSCLIAMALSASQTGCLPVNEIYHYIEQKYPFFKTAPEGWKNSIRHNLSMNQNFVKVLRSDGYQPRKGYHWAINPKRRHALQLEIERTLRIIQQDITDHKNSSGDNDMDQYKSGTEQVLGIKENHDYHHHHAIMQEALLKKQQLVNSMYRRPEMMTNNEMVDGVFLLTHFGPFYASGSGAMHCSKQEPQYLSSDYHHDNGNPNIEQVIITDEDTDGADQEDSLKPFEWVEKECIIENEEEVSTSSSSATEMEAKTLPPVNGAANTDVVDSSFDCPTLSIESMLKNMENEEPICSLTPSSSSASSNITHEETSPSSAFSSNGSLPFAHFEATVV